MRKLKLFFACLLMAVLSIGQVWATTYQATAVTSTTALENGAKYIILQDGHALINQVTSNKAQTTDTYSTTGLSGNETYVWILEASSTNWKLKSAAATTYYMSYQTGSNKGRMNYATSGNAWTITYASSKWKFVDSESRFLGYTNSTDYEYKTYANTNYSSGTYPNDISLLKLSEETTSYTITAESNNTTYGTVSLEGNAITGSPAANCRYASPAYTVTSGAATVSQSNNVFTVTPISDCTVRINFEAIPDYTVIWDNNGNTSVTTQVYEGEKPVFPATPAACDGSSTTFIGWATNKWDGKATDLEDSKLSGISIYTSASAMPDVAGAVTYYAVFAHVEAGDPSWTLTSIGDLTEDDIFVFADASDYALQNDGGASNEVAAVGITVEEGEITSTVPNNLKWNISGNSTDGYTFYPNGSTTTWLYCNTTAASKSNDNMRVGTGARKLYVIESVTGYIKTNDENTTRYIGRNGTTTFRGYTNTNTNPVVPKFYKYTEGGSTSDYMTTCVATSKCATPTFGVAQGTYNTAQSVTLSCGTAGAKIKYTTNGDDPDADHGTVYNEAITVDKDMVIKAYAYKEGMDDSDPAEATYVLKPKTPVISGTENFWGTTEVSITCATDGAAIYYKLNDGDETLYADPFTIDANANIKAVAKKTDWTNSEEATADFTKIVPLTVAQAIEIIGTGTAEQKTGAYVTGIVSELVEFSSQYGNYTYYISDDGTTSNQLQAFRGQDFDGDNFTAATDIALGDVVVVRGNLLYHNTGGNELNTGNRIIERTKRVVSLELSNDGTAYPVEFTKGDAFSHEHMVVTATYNSTHFAAEAVQENPACTWSGYDANTLGEQEITVSYGGQSVNYNVTVLGYCTNSAVITKGATEHGSFELSVEGTQCLDELPGNVTSTVLTATPEAYYYLASVTATNGTVGVIDGNSCTISNIGANTTITAVFEPIPLNPWATVYTSNVTNLSSDVDVAVVIGTENIDALKANKSSSATFTIPAGTTNLYAHIIAWNGDAANVTISGACFNEPKEQAIISDASIAGTGSTFDIDDSKVPYDYFYEITLDKAVTAPTEITITAASQKRFVIFGVNAVYPAEITLDPTSYAFGEVKEGLTKSQEFTITANAMCTGDLAAEIIGTDADKFEVSAIDANKVTVTFAPEVGEIGNFEAQLQVSCTNASVTANLTATGISATQPEISVDQTLVEFGSVPQGNPLASQAVAVTLSNISTGATALISGTAFSIDPENLAASGDITITPNTSLAPGNYSEKLTISATGATTKEVTVTMTIQDKWIVTYTSNIVLTADASTKASNATVVINEVSYEAIKVGVNGTNGSVAIIVPAHTTKLNFHAAGWKDKSVTLKANGTQDTPISADAALTGSTTTYELASAPNSYNFTIEDNAQPTTIIVSGNERFVIYGVNVDTYKRDVKVGNYGTLCVKNGGILSGATLFEIAERYGSW